MEYNEKDLALIEALSNARGAAGFEEEVLEIARAAMKGIADVEEDKLRNLYFYRRKNTGNKPVVMLDAHSDEVSFMVHSIKPNGTLRVVNLGRWTNSTLPSSKVKVRNAEGKWISGVFVNKPTHFQTAEDFKADQPISAFAIDIGASSDKEAKEVFKVRMGEPVVPATRFEFDEASGLMFGKAFDCRIGCAALIKTMQMLDSVDLDVDIVGVLSSQEEMLERGCRVAVNHVKPDMAICFEGTPADDTFLEPYAVQTALKKGPMFRHMDVSVICSPRLQRYILDFAAEKNLKVQESVREGGGNNASVINTALEGVPVVTCGVPVRYIHSMNCITSYQDYMDTAVLVSEVLKSLNQDFIDSL